MHVLFLYSCATEEGPFGAETFCLLVKKVYHVFNAQVIPTLSLVRQFGHESIRELLSYPAIVSAEDLYGGNVVQWFPVSM